ncbi:dihydrofolate reductase family protein [Antrihabitans sp. YC3-6]|uniref:Dihydrofolate reductase family protein n=1 Tax=Antrihabitans stalagmiti TaxID=2799499 RepID=A0A934NP27_9NOCA|nr:dihydrofolate reductase family protein [Antrihabitans stalagmiti]MBJ8338768.1 dihydrofolate reductase family protein [Antrihabitans stalagmiti]
MRGVLLDMAVSLDGYISTPEGGDAGLYNWYFSDGPKDKEIVDEIQAITGAIVLGRNAYAVTDDNTGDVADEPYQVPHFVITHNPPASPVADPRMRFVTDPATALTSAAAEAGDRYVTVGGGADIVRQMLRASLIDEVQLHVAPVLLGAGLSLFDTLDTHVGLTPVRTIAGEGALHVWYRVDK